jgi:hypothetical protein
MPAYAQAVTSHWAELLYDGGGALAPGDMPMARLIYNTPPDITPPRNYRTWAGSQSVAVYARRAVGGSGALLVVGTVQPQSSAVGNAPLAVNATLRLPGGDGAAGGGPSVALEFRRQGSTYIVKTRAAASGRHGVRSVESVVQLDAWHEASHPAYWAADIQIEAEVHDGLRVLDVARGSSRRRRPARPAVRTEQAAGAAEGDFRSFTTWIELGLAAAAGAAGEAAAAAREAFYTVRPRCAVAAGSAAAGAASCEFSVAVRVRGGCVTVDVAGAGGGTGGGTVAAELCARARRTSESALAWEWVVASGVVSLQRDVSVVVRVAAAGNATVHVDALRLTSV